MRKLILLCFFLLNLLTASGQELKKEWKKAVADFIVNIKNQQKEKLADNIAFPLKRKYPLPVIKSKEDFVKRFQEVFDPELIKLISNSTPSKDWFAIGSRGIMFHNGMVWLDFDGRLKAVNYQSLLEQQQRTKLIEKEKASLHPSISSFDEPVLICETEKYRIRIDAMSNQQYRYAVWPLKSKKGDKPDLVIGKGTLIFDGSGGNHRYEFKNAGYTYNLNIWMLNEKGSPRGLLTIYEGNKKILGQDVVSISK